MTRKNRNVHTGRIHKASDEDDEDEEDEDEEDEDEDEDKPKGKPNFMKKSEAYALDDLEKGLEALELAAQRTPSRRSDLLEKAKSDRLSRGERDELEDLMNGSRLSERISQDDTLAKGMDVSPALDVLATNVSESVDHLSDLIEKSMSVADERFAAMSNAMNMMGDALRTVVEENAELRKSMEDVLDAPARAPRASERPISKGIDRPAQAAIGDGGEQPRIGKKELIHVLEMMHSDSVSKSLGGNSRSGFPIRNEMAMVMADQPLSQQMALEVAAFIKQMGLNN